MKAVLTFNISNDDGSSFSGATVTWDNLDRVQANALEGKGIAFLSELNKWGAQVALTPKPAK